MAAPLVGLQVIIGRGRGRSRDRGKELAHRYAKGPFPMPNFQEGLKRLLLPIARYDALNGATVEPRRGRSPILGVLSYL